MQTLGVYIHIPFCVQKCVYCDFLSAPATRERQQTYLNALKREIKDEAKNYTEYVIETVFFGGGTPSILKAEDIAECIGLLKANYFMSANAEITIEMNPGTASKEKLEGLKRAGVNRLSIGLQSAQNEELKMLGRIHTWEEFVDTYKMARKVGFANINVDLMSALPGQNIKAWEDTLRKVLELEPEHISAYSLIIEEGTVLYDRLEEYPPIPSEEEDRMMYQRTKILLSEKGYERYEISNYAKKGCESRHNTVYWVRKSYVGFGLGASSMVADRRWSNTGEMAVYLDAEIEKKEEFHILTQEECMEEYMFLGLRMIQGVSEKKFFELYGKQMEDVYGKVISKWIKEGFLQKKEDRVSLTDKGIDVSNVILAEFLL
ncbi:MAG: oxygen-independent coproporphyrinogen III oxidase [Lachnospiraceae bacterium]|nr:oxygen-independent coproporphyrinogen III oxidase [Lachnospiraceae bacterium]